MTRHATRKTIERHTDVGLAAPPRLRLLVGPGWGGLLLALLAWGPALTPSLIPRSWETQAVINALVLAITYALGALLAQCLGRLPRQWRTAWRAGRGAWVVLGLGWLVGVPLGAVMWLDWQNGQRNLMGMRTLDELDAVWMVLLSLLGSATLVLVGRLLGRLTLAVVGLARRRLPLGPAAPAAGLALFFLAVGLAGRVAWLGFAAYVDTVATSINAETHEGIERPTSPSVSGSSASLVSWESLGRWGRYFVASVTTASEFEAFHGAGARFADPVRVYVGFDSADTAARRAELAVRELDRAGGFERAILVVVVPTGSGWIVPEAADALELMHRGDTAIVAIQYAFLSSLLTAALKPGAEVEAGLELFAAVHAHWSGLPPERRPKLLVFGKSLGTPGVEVPFLGADAAASLANLAQRTDGALIVGAKLTNPIHAQLTRARDPGSPVWQPVFDGGRAVRFLSRDPGQPALDPVWPTPRFAYLQHPSDPVTLWWFDVIWRKPEWMAPPRGFDVPEAAGWFPLVSAVHAAADLYFQLNVPPGFGHVYATEYAGGWAAILPPTGWTDADTARLNAFLDTPNWGESEFWTRLLADDY